jgi:hypothetical protein
MNARAKELLKGWLELHPGRQRTLTHDAAILFADAATRDSLDVPRLSRADAAAVFRVVADVLEAPATPPDD